MRAFEVVFILFLRNKWVIALTLHIHIFAYRVIEAFCCIDEWHLRLSAIRNDRKLFKHKHHIVPVDCCRRTVRTSQETCSMVSHLFIHSDFEGILFHCEFDISHRFEMIQCICDLFVLFTIVFDLDLVLYSRKQTILTYIRVCIVRGRPPKQLYCCFCFCRTFNGLTRVFRGNILLIIR